MIESQGDYALAFFISLEGLLPLMENVIKTILKKGDIIMGFFDLKATCSVCNKEVGLNRFQIANKEWICPECFKKCNGFKLTKPIKNMTVDDIKMAMSAKEANVQKIAEFNPTKKISTYMEFDDENKKWLVPGMFGGKTHSKVYDYSDIVDFELLEDGTSISKGGLGRAIVGGALLGGVGAVVGGVTGGKKSKNICNNLQIKITVNDMNNPAVFVKFLYTETKKDSWSYKTIYKAAQECLSILQLICDLQQQNNVPAEQQPSSAADEILKYKSLLDNGIVTQEEFEAKKKQLLGL